tara:strand:- start:6072 stop:6848 length:777 start_codon:yes stop_codon:yes gene_type:complete
VRLKKLIILILVLHFGVCDSQSIETDFSKATFIIKSNIFFINGIESSWEYDVAFVDSNKTSQNDLVKLIRQRLINASSNEILMELDLTNFIDIQEYEIATLRNWNGFQEDFDINFDGFTDLQFRTMQSSSGNQEYIVYLFRPITKSFEFVKELSGGSLEEGILLDPKNKIATYSSKGGGGLYSFKKIHFDNGIIKYIEKYWNSAAVILSDEETSFIFHYQKIIDNVIKEKIEIPKRIKNKGLESIYSPFFEWVRTFKK